MLRAMLLEFLDDPACDYLDRQYLLGDALLVAPVFNAEGDVDFYLPAGRRTHLFSGKQLDGGRWMRESHGFTSLPLYMRPNTLLALGTEDQRPDYDYARRSELHLFELGDGATATVTLRDLDGTAVTHVRVTRQGDMLRVRHEGVQAPLRLVLRRRHSVRDAGGLPMQAGESGVSITLPMGEGEGEGEGEVTVGV
jgi:alpha-D-xyloside xylohydrolase